ncbi:MAG: hypothetical protein K2F80_01660 [Muribaculaceae bacterium]|nr:hypothetical protein [Muribaculaceae bacterium]
MTVKELFNSLSFDEIVKALKNTHRNEGSIKCLAGYKEAFDIIRNTNFEGPGGEVTFDVMPREKWYEPHSLPLLALNVEGDFWHNTVGKDVIKPEYNPFTDAELAGAILWGMTFYGFTPRRTKELFNNKIDRKSFTKYGLLVKKLQIKSILPYVSAETRKELKRQLKDEPDRMTYYLSSDEWRNLGRRRLHLNRSKRKRQYRIDKRINQLKKLEKRQHLLDTLVKRTNVPVKNIESTIFNAGEIYETWRETHVYGKSDRVDYLIDLLANFSPTLEDICKEATEVIVVAYTSDKCSLTVDEDNRLYDALNPTFIVKDIRSTLIKGVDNDVKDEIALQIIVISADKTVN